MQRHVKETIRFARECLLVAAVFALMNLLEFGRHSVADGFDEHAFSHLFIAIACIAPIASNIHGVLYLMGAKRKPQEGSSD